MKEWMLDDRSQPKPADILAALMEFRDAFMRGFEKMNERFHSIERRFDRVDRCFDKMERRFDEMERRRNR